MDRRPSRLQSLKSQGLNFIEHTHDIAHIQKEVKWNLNFQKPNSSNSKTSYVDMTKYDKVAANNLSGKLSHS